MTQIPHTVDVSRPSLPDSISAALRQQISSGVLKPGPVRIIHLARQFNVSAVPIREALQQLAAEGLVSFDQYKSVIVNSLSVADMREIYEMRIALEPLAVTLAVPVIQQDPEVLGSLRSMVDEMGECVSDHGRWLELNSAFHWGTYNVLDKPRLLRTVRSLWNAVEPYLRVYVIAALSLADANEEHRAMLAAITAGDKAQAADLLRQHLLETLKIVEEGLAADPNRSEFARH
jgi:DNA-binding GntR family transcriptional regulator